MAQIIVRGQALEVRGSSEEEVEAGMLARLTAMATSAGVLPRLTADRTPRRLLDALRAP